MAIPVRLMVLVLVQLKVVPAILLGFVITKGVIATPLQRVCVKGATATVGSGFTVTEAVVVVEPQPLAEAVMVNIVV